MPTTDVYHLALSRGHRNLAVAVMVALSLFGIVMLVATARRAPFEPPGLPIAILFCAVTAWNWYVLLTLPYEIRFFESPDRIRFTALARTLTLPVASLHSIKPYRSGGGIYVIRHDDGKIRLVAQFTGLHEVITRLKAANPNFEVVGI